MDLKRSKRLQKKSTSNEKTVLFDDTIVKPPTWNKEQEDLIAKAGLIGIWSLNQRDKSLKESNILLHQKDKFTADILRKRLTTKTINDTKFTPTERVILDRDLYIAIIPLHVRSEYTPGTVGTSCCPACNTECGESCLCRYTKIECRHVHSCPQTTIRDGRFPVTVVCEQHYTDEKGVEMKMLGVRTMEDIEKDQVVGVYCGTISRKTCKITYHPSSYSINISKGMIKLKDEQIFIDGYPCGNTMILVNDPGKSKLTNVKLIVIQTCNTFIPVLQATRPIKKHSFLFFEYGQQFWKDGFVPGEPKEFKDPLYPDQQDQQPAEEIALKMKREMLINEENDISIGDQVVVKIGYYVNLTGVVTELQYDLARVDLKTFNRSIPILSLKKL